MRLSAFIVLVLTLVQTLISPPTTHAQACREQISCGVEVALSSAPVDAHVINAYGPPPVTRIMPNEDLLYDRLYQRVLQPVEIYDAPNGTVINVLDAGFNFVTTLDNTPDGWTMINQGQWVRSEHLRTVYPSRFAGILLPEVLPQYPIAWILVNAIPSQTPGTEPVPGTLAILRYTLVNLFAEVEIDGWNWYQVGSDQWVHQTQLARVIPVERPADIDTDRWISVDLYEQVAIAYEGVRPVWATLVSSGLAEWPTNEGIFHIYARFPRTIMSGAEGQADFYYLEEVPWTMYFDNDIGLHGTYWHDGFGYRHSHGCVNLSITDAAWLYHWASSEIDLTVPGDLGAAVYVYSSGQYR